MLNFLNVMHVPWDAMAIVPTYPFRAKPTCSNSLAATYGHVLTFWDVGKKSKYAISRLPCSLFHFLLVSGWHMLWQ